MGILHMFLLLEISAFVYGEKSMKHTFWRRNSTKEIYQDIAFTMPNSNIGKCSLQCESISDCQSFSIDTYSSACTGYLTTFGQIMTSFSKDHWYFSRSEKGTVSGNTGSSECIADGGGLDLLSNANQNYYEFTTCGQTGNTGPTVQLCTNQASWASISSSTVLTNGVQQWLVPETASYRIEAFGAAGGSGDGGVGGEGARISGTFSITGGIVLNIVCGQKGGNGGVSESGGGGGGTFVYTDEIGGENLLIAAGGGGGAGEESTHNGYDGQCGQFALGSTGYNGSDLSEIGGLGYGGLGGSYSAAGAGWLSDGGAMVLNSANPGTRWLGGAVPTSTTGIGGFGGGASGVFTNGGGGGGGYTGGYGATSTVRTSWGGSGAGSFNGGTHKNTTSGYNSNDGFVIIAKL